MARADRGVPIRSAEELVMARRAAQLAAEVLAMIEPHVVPGVTTDALDRLCHDHIVNVQGARPANVGYLGYPKTVLTSVNHVVCHGIPSPQQMLKKGDIVNIDVAVEKDGWYGDTSRMFGVGKIAPKSKRLIDVTYEALERGIAAVKPGARLGDIGHAIQSFVEAQRCSVVQDFCGHGVGRVFHDNPTVLHFGRPGTGDELKPGMFFTIEPMVNLGRKEVKVLSDGWTAVTRDKSLSAQCEHSIAVTETGAEVFTLSPAGLFKPPLET